MNVIAYDVRPRPDWPQELGFRYVSFEQLLTDSDIISLHANLNPSSYHILNRKAFAKCRPGVVIINTARGKLIDTNALIEALDQGIVGGAGLDVLGEESVMRRRAERIISDQIIQKLRESVERPTVRKRIPFEKGDRKAHASRQSAFAARGCLHAAHRIQLRGSHRADQSCHRREHQSLRCWNTDQYTVAGHRSGESGNTGRRWSVSGADWMKKKILPGTGFRLCDSGTRRSADNDRFRGADAYNRLRS